MIPWHRQGLGCSKKAAPFQHIFLWNKGILRTEPKDSGCRKYYGFLLPESILLQHGVVLGNLLQSTAQQE